MHKDDHKWITEQLKKLPTPLMRTTVLTKYKAAFDEAHNNEPLQHRKDGKARSTANNRLREYVAKVVNITALK